MGKGQKAKVSQELLDMAAAVAGGPSKKPRISEEAGPVFLMHTETHKDMHGRTHAYTVHVYIAHVVSAISCYLISGCRPYTRVTREYIVDGS